MLSISVLLKDRGAQPYCFCACYVDPASFVPMEGLIKVWEWVHGFGGN